MGKLETPIRCAVIGYGPHHIFGRAHGRWIDATPDLEWVAVCDTDPERLAAATDEFSHLETYVDLAEMLDRSEIDMVSIVTPHYTHAPIALECIRAGKHVVVDKAMCLNVTEATAMIDAARENGVVLAVFHARRHDGNYRAIVETVRSGAIGDVFHVELTAGGFGRPQDWWYNRKAQGGGGFYYWGPHAIDWVLNLVGGQVEGVTGFYHKLVWDHVDVEDQSRAIMRFDNGTVADVTWSRIDAAGKPLWRILGTKGAIVDMGAGGNKGYQDEIAGPSGGSFQLITIEDGKRSEQTVPYRDSDWLTYYLEVADHLLRDGPVPVTGEDGRRTIAVFEAAEKSSETGITESVQYE
ncbi:MAG: Gfo/Idh/MocA family oxidoreductase [Candidatus Latescibacteria bacterium]|nr:Gfo/Idh/MocA family oxidoreductase [Candidatus Latescibacterota bacterium]